MKRKIFLDSCIDIFMTLPLRNSRYHVFIGDMLFLEPSLSPRLYILVYLYFPCTYTLQYHNLILYSYLYWENFIISIHDFLGYGRAFGTNISKVRYE